MSDDRPHFIEWNTWRVRFVVSTEDRLHEKIIIAYSADEAMEDIRRYHHNGTVTFESVAREGVVHKLKIPAP